MSKLRHLAFLLLALWAAQVFAGANENRPITLSINGQAVRAEVVTTPQERERGLMFREKLGKNEGMLFVFDQIGYHGMWMKNTLIPLAVAFMDEKGVILNIAEMEPHSEITHSAAGPARFALEMRGGWFLANKITKGMSVKGLEKAPPGR